MSYLTIHQCATDPLFGGRVTACCAQEGAADPVNASASIMWPVSSAADIEAAYESAVIAGNPNPGADGTVVTDQMILSAVQAHLPGGTP